MPSILIKNAQIVTMNAQEEIIQGDLLIVDDKIKSIGKDLGNQADRVIDATNKTVIPGFIQTHIHLCQTLFRGQADDLELMDWLQKGFGRWKLHMMKNQAIIQLCWVWGIDPKRNNDHCGHGNGQPYRFCLSGYGRKRYTGPCRKSDDGYGR